jgi:hypothetical protein
MLLLPRPVIIFLQFLALVEMICIPPYYQNVFCFEDVDKGGPLTTTFETRNTHILKVVYITLMLCLAHTMGKPCILGMHTSKTSHILDNYEWSI